ncbi:hypothetical protein OS123_04645 [Corynebacterium sp. P5875]|uniref:Uncharacterized protein n=1 Tax=Corynebacterium antarcticum TaxID=2800405 RepID=A0A9Q4GKE1_9CORY|nr:hypothetical protein [Corynebacterium antarcticum]MCX7537832.1 hypothetical protein [Corynebacterium antarcticum]
MIRVIRAEFVRTKNTTVAYFPLLGFVLAGMGILTGYSDAGRGAWQALYVTGMAAPLMALLSGLPEKREKTCREGGTGTRPVSPRLIRGGRLIVLLIILAAMLACDFGTLLMPVAWVCAWIGAAGLVALFGVISRWIGLIPALLVAVVWQVTGTLTAEHPLWILLPPTWAVRIMLPVLGVHSNAVPLDPGDPLATESPTTAAVLCLVSAVLAATAYVLIAAPRTRPDRSTAPITSHTGTWTAEPAADLRKGRASAGAALNHALLRTVLTPLTLGALALIAVAGSWTADLAVHLILPLGCGVAAVVTWTALQPAWRITVHRTRRVIPGVIVWLDVLVAAMGLGTDAVLALRGTPLPEVLRVSGLLIVVGTVMVTAALALCVRTGPGAVIVATVFLTVLSVTLGGSVLADTALWLPAMPAWPLTATGGRLPVALIMGTALLIVSTGLAHRELRRAAAR